VQWKILKVKFAKIVESLEKIKENVKILS